MSEERKLAIVGCIAKLFKLLVWFISDILEMISCLPIEVLELVFSFLTNRDLEHVVLVSRLWREVGENPMLWSWGYVTVTQVNLPKLGLRRMRNVETLALRGHFRTYHLEEFLLSLSHLPKMRFIYGLSFNLHDLSLVDPAVLSAAVSMCQDVHLYMCQLTPLQVLSLISFLLLSNL